MGDRLERFLTMVVGLAVIAVATVVIRREFFPSGRAPVPAGPPQFVEQWRDLLPTARMDGPASAPMIVVEFADLECPACRVFHRALRAVQHANPGQVSTALIHFPLPYHRFARPAARAAECAHAQGAFMPMVDAIYAAQDSLGLKSWTALGRVAGVPDSSRLAACANSSRDLALVDSGLAVGRRFGVSGTPTVLLNGWRYGAPPDSIELERALSEIRQGRTPFAKSTER